MFSIGTTNSPSLFTMARSKLHSVVGAGAKDNCSLHRWVLLKNSIVRSHSPAVPVVSTDTSPSNDVQKRDGEEEEEETFSEEEDMFVFPDAGVFVDAREAEPSPSEAQWLDSLLETLGDERGDDDSDSQVSVSPDDDFSPPISPLSSSDDLFSPHSCYPSVQTVQHPVYYPPDPYPPYHPLVRRCPLDSDFHAALDSCPHSAYADDVDDLSVPDAIEDTSDDESDAPTTPFARSTASLVDPASIPLPVERTRSGRHPHVYIDTDDSYFYPFELDPPSFPDDHVHSSPAFPMQEC
ncbi:hypothetical protein OE88DRAFT_1805621 [Heliocybe sulcata]|uniref:Uncharacterized protein n=1 Tax=Heliocybe sulcata TaxID=5364 RepID=A0A5C3NED0_9AGAM|nr:hypothetical protein OE88DRAFT_1805621 [Heliocybe sulcata]